MRLSMQYLNRACRYFHAKIFFWAVCTSLFATYSVAQQADPVNANTEAEDATIQAPEVSNTNSSANTALKPDASKQQLNKKMVQDATISLQTTITGNQEQPKVLYILPWQSPQTENVDFEPLDNQQKAVFNHVERDELRRELEVADELQ